MPAAIGETIAVLLAAGLSRRYGADDKLMARWRGRPLVAHAAGLLAGLPFAGRIAVVSAAAGPVAGVLGGRFDLVVNDAPELGQDRSLRIGLRAAVDAGARHVLVCLGDMPDVTAEHVAAVLAAGGERAVMSAAGDATSPPVLMPRAVAQAVLDRPDARVRDVLRGTDPVKVAAVAATLRDFDTPEDFARKSSPARGDGSPQG